MRTRYRMATAQARSTSAVLGCTHRGKRSEATAKTAFHRTDPSPWMKDQVAYLVQQMADGHDVCVPPPIVRAELSCYLRDCASLFRMSRLEARLFVTDDMLQASARELGAVYGHTAGRHDPLRRQEQDWTP